MVSFYGLPLDNSLQNILGDQQEEIHFVIGQGFGAFHTDSNNDGLLDMSGEVQHYKAVATESLKTDQKWYGLSDVMIDIDRVEVLNSDGKYEVVPRLIDADVLLESDPF